MADDQRPSKLEKLSQTLKARFDLADPGNTAQIEQVLDDALADLGKALREPETADAISNGITRMMEEKKPYTDKANSIAKKIRQDLLQAFSWIDPKDVIFSTRTDLREGSTSIEFMIEIPRKDAVAVRQWSKEKGKQDLGDVQVKYIIEPDAIPDWLKSALQEARSAPKPGPA